MSQKPLHLSAAGPKNDRQAMWEIIRKLGHGGSYFTTGDIRRGMKGGIRQGRVYDYVKCLVAAGILKRDEQDQIRLTLVEDRGIEAPRVRPDGSEVETGSVRENMWRSMKILGNFTAKELAIAASTAQSPCGVNTAIEYCRYLNRAGYLAGGPEGFVFIRSRYTGPRPPAIQRIKQVFDHNLGKVVWPEVDHV